MTRSGSTWWPSSTARSPGRARRPIGSRLCRTPPPRAVVGPPARCGDGILLELADRAERLGVSMRLARTSTMPAHSPSPNGSATASSTGRSNRSGSRCRASGRRSEGIEIVSVADRRELWREAYDPLALQAFDDMALDRPVLASLEQWERDWLSWPEGMFLALDGRRDRRLRRAGAGHRRPGAGRERAHGRAPRPARSRDRVVAQAHGARVRRRQRDPRDLHVDAAGQRRACAVSTSTWATWSGR